MTEITSDIALTIALKRREFDETRSPMAAIALTILCHKAGGSPPENVTEFLAKSFESWLDSDGATSLESALGLSRPGQAGNALKESVRRLLEEQLMLEFAHLRWRFGLSYDEAAEMITQRMDSTEWNFTSYELGVPSETTLIDKYRKKWARILDNPDTAEIKRRFMNEPDEAKKAVLENYPRHAWQHIDALKSFL